MDIFISLAYSEIVNLFNSLTHPIRESERVRDLALFVWPVACDIIKEMAKYCLKDLKFPFCLNTYDTIFPHSHCNFDLLQAV